MNVLGIDSSIRATGIARLSGGFLTTRVIRTEDPMAELGTAVETIEYIAQQVLREASRDRRWLFVIESPAFMRKRKGGLQAERAGLYYLLAGQLLRRGDVATVAPPTRAVYAADHGRADKPAVLAAMRARIPHVDIEDDNAADALAMCAMGARWLGSPIDGDISSKQQKAMRTARWPEMKGSK